MHQCGALEPATNLNPEFLFEPLDNERGILICERNADNTDAVGC